MNKIRKELNNLMGEDRDMPLKERQRHRKHFDDREVCSFYLLDFCPHDLFPNTKSDLGPCKKRHDIFFKNQFLSNANREQYRVRYEEVLEDFLERLISDADVKIKRGIERIEAILPETDKSKEILEQVEFINNKIEEFAVEAERLGEQGMIDQSELVMKNIDSLKEQKNELLQISEHPLIAKEKQMKICEICGALQSAQDGEKRLQTHYEGRLHKGYAKIREVLGELKKKKLERTLKTEDEREKERKYREKVDQERLIELEKIGENQNPDLGNYFDQNTFDKKLKELSFNGFVGKFSRGKPDKRGGGGGNFNNFKAKFNSSNNNNNNNSYSNNNKGGSYFNDQGMKRGGEEPGNSSKYDEVFNSFNELGGKDKEKSQFRERERYVKQDNREEKEKYRERDREPRRYDREGERDKNRESGREYKSYRRERSRSHSEGRLKKRY
mmetsp:Transcript_7531/g.7751  ORF Transcript_7531/g.7751 Transcript_7531/m.7751 type:complete len:442 (+) Transcript_7531:15-1340(+)